MIAFAHPIWLIVGLCAACLASWFFYDLANRRQNKLARFTSPQLVEKLTANVSYPRRRLKYAMQIMAIGCLFLALARPQYGDQWIEVKRKGIDLLFAIDTSKSMLTEDTKPNRLQRAKLAILDFVDQLEGDRVGLLPFAGSAYLMCPLTLDYQAFGESLAAINTTIIPKGGTDLGTMIRSAAEALHNSANHKILIILSDGENLQGDAIQAAQETAVQGLTIYTIGVGTTKGELIPLPKEEGGGFQKDEKGNFVTSRLEESGLQAIARASNGLYLPLGPAGEGLLTVYRQKLADLPKQDLMERRQKIPIERFSWPLSLGVLLLFLEFLLSDSKSKQPWRKIFPWSIKKGTIVTILLGFFSLALHSPALASPGEEAFARGDFQQAEQYYQQRLTESPDDPKLLYNYGSAAYKTEKFAEAAEAFTKSLHSDDPVLQENGYYNRGNSFSQLGEQRLSDNPQQAGSLWQEAIDSYKSALTLNPNNENAAHNLKLVEKKLEQLKQQQQQNETGQDKSDKSKKSGEDQKQDQTGSDMNEEHKADGADQKDNESPKDASESSENPSNKKENPQSAADQPRPESQEQGGESSLNEVEPTAPGEMTRQEAVQLLDSLKSEEGTLNFVPNRGNEPTVSRDW